MKSALLKVAVAAFVASVPSFVNVAAVAYADSDDACVIEVYGPAYNEAVELVYGRVTIPEHGALANTEANLQSLLSAAEQLKAAGDCNAVINLDTDAH